VYDHPQSAFGDAGDGFQEQHLLLEVRGEEEQVHHLADAGTGPAEAAGDLGAIRDAAGVDQALEVLGEGQEGGGVRGTRGQTG